MVMGSVGASTRTVGVQATMPPSVMAVTIAVSVRLRTGGVLEQIRSFVMMLNSTVMMAWTWVLL
jgi:hypothetical protein